MKIEDFEALSYREQSAVLEKMSGTEITDAAAGVRLLRCQAQFDRNKKRLSLKGLSEEKKKALKGKQLELEKSIHNLNKYGVEKIRGERPVGALIEVGGRS